MTSHYQDGGHDVRPPFSAAYTTAFAGCPLK